MNSLPQAEECALEWHLYTDIRPPSSDPWIPVAAMDVQEYEVDIEELVQLTDLGISLFDIQWSKLRVTSHKWFSVTHRRADRWICTVYDEACERIRSYEVQGLVSSQVSPKGDQVAFSTPNKIFVRNLTKDPAEPWNRFPNDVTPEYWTWISNDAIALVCSDCVYKWIVRSPVVEPVFDRLPRCLQGQGQVTGCQFDPDYRWAIVTLLRKEQDDTVTGLVQVYSAHHTISNCIEAHAALLTRHKFPGNSDRSQLLIIAKKCTSDSAKISIVDISLNKSAGPAVKSEKFPWTREDDFPSSIVHSESKGLIFLLSKFGTLCVFDIDTCAPLVINERVCTDIVFASVIDATGEGVVAYSRNGQVLRIKVRRHINYTYEQVTRL